MTELYKVRDIFSSGVKRYQPDVLKKREHVYLRTVLKLYALINGRDLFKKTCCAEVTSAGVTSDSG